MKNPYLLASILNLVVFAGVWIHARHRFLLPFGIYVLVAGACVPVPLRIASGRYLFLGDFVGVALLVTCLLAQGRRAQTSRFASAVLGLYSLGLVAWPLASTVLAVKQLNETTQPGDVAIFILRSAAQLGFFWWAARTGAAVLTVKPLLAIPAAFWLLFMIFGILQFTGMIDIDAFWYLNRDFTPTHLTSGFMGMDKPQLALWSSYGTCIALWLMAADSGGLGWAALTIPFLSGLVILSIGSRQGLIGIGLAMVCASVLIGLSSSGRKRLIRVPLALAAALAVWPVAWNSIDRNRREFILSEFEQLQDATSLDELARRRDPTSLILVGYISSDPHRLYLGSGVATDKDPGDGGLRTFAEGEYLRVLWSGGVISLACYVALLLVLLGQGARSLWCEFRFQQGEGALLCAMTMVGGFFAFGQHHLATTMYHNVPCNYLLMMTAGLLGGAVTRSCALSKLNQRPHNEGWTARARKSLNSHQRFVPRQQKRHQRIG
jgi:hypothetical protein